LKSKKRLSHVRETRFGTRTREGAAATAAARLKKKKKRRGSRLDRPHRWVKCKLETNLQVEKTKRMVNEKTLGDGTRKCDRKQVFTRELNR